jgi:hypothetical protein
MAIGKSPASLCPIGSGSVKFQEKNPPREFKVGANRGITMRDCGAITLNPEEQVTFLASSAGEYDVARKEWGFYATPSLNGRLPSFQIKSALVKNTDGRFFVMLVEKEKSSQFEAYLQKEKMTVVCYLDDEESLRRIEALFLGEQK